jgi:diguanylate cyclase (GGDEF)-like protein/PAS domain S-box-containing protein
MAAPAAAQSAPAVLGAGACHSFACAIIDGMAEQMAVLAADGTIVAVNQAWRDFAATHRKPGTAPLQTDVGVDYLAVCRSGGADAAAAGIAAVLAGGPIFALEYDCHDAAQQRWFHMTVTPLGYGWGGAAVAHHDITAQRQAAAALRIAAVAIDSFEGMMVTDARGEIVRVNRGFTRVTGYSAEEAVGRRPSMLSSGRHDTAFYRQMWAALGAVGHWQGEIWNRRKSGEIYPEYLSIAAVRDADGTLSHYVAVLTDITQRKAESEAIRELAFYDPLTRLPNRRLLLERLRQQLKSGGRRDGCGALLFIDLDHFKALNDQFGHRVGDLLLQQVARRLQDGVRQSDTVARLGGDEFVVLCDGLDAGGAAAQATALAGKLLAALNQPYVLGAQVWHSTSSIGVTLFDAGCDQAGADLLMQADVAMYQAKRSGRNSLCCFDQAMQDAIDLRGERERRLRSAIALQRFELHYQLQVDGDGRPRGAAAQLGWRHADGALEPAAQFAALAEETGLLAPLGEWVLEQACAQLHTWQGLPVLRALVLSVDLGASQWRQPGLAERVLAALARRGATASLLCLELPAALAAQPGPAITAVLHALDAAGVRLALAGEGEAAGALSLRQLRHLPLTQLTLAPSLVAELGIAPGAAGEVRAMIALADGLGIDVLAAGVDSAPQRALLRQLGVQVCQGCWHSPPLPLPEFEALALRPADFSLSSTVINERGLPC